MSVCSHSTILPPENLPSCYGDVTQLDAVYDRHSTLLRSVQLRGKIHCTEGKHGGFLGQSVSVGQPLGKGSRKAPSPTPGETWGGDCCRGEEWEKMSVLCI